MRDRSVPSVALISMPTSSARFPCLQLGILKPALERAGIAAEIFPFYVHFGAHIGWRFHEALAQVAPFLPGEWIWAGQAFDSLEEESAYTEYYRTELDELCRSAECTIEDLIRVRRELTGSFLDQCLEWTDWSRFRVVGFTVLFQQQMATLALARRLKARYPNLPILLGGGTMEEDIAREILRNCPQVDFIHCGEADENLPEIVFRIHRGESLHGLSGVHGWEGSQITGQGRAPNLADMDRTPVPDYDEYFQAVEAAGYMEYFPEAKIFLPIETSRGCWWGEKSHCAFCGQNHVGIKYRSKSVDKVLTMLEQLSTRYGLLDFDAVDNALDLAYVEDLFGPLAEAHADFSLTYAVRATLSRGEIARMRAGGLNCIQSGIESFSTHVLKLMRKGTTAVGNLELLKWTTYFGINNLYNILTGLPGETVEDYREQRRLFECIPHLQPPYAIVPARPDRGSPMFLNPAAFSITNLRPEEVYRFLWPSDRFDMSRISYFFVPEIEGAVSEREYEELARIGTDWQQRWLSEPKPFLNYQKTLESIRIKDGRTDEVYEYHLAGREADLYEFCGDARTLEAIERRFGGPGAWMVQFLEESIHRRLMVLLDGKYLSLALPENRFHQ